MRRESTLPRRYNWRIYETYVADASNTIRRLSPDGMVRTVAGTAGVAGAAPGPAPGVLGPIRGLTWSGNALFATIDNAVLKISFSQ